MKFGQEFVLPGLVSLMLATNACADSRPSSTPVPKPRITYSPTATFVDIGLPADLLSSYPELLQTGLRVKSGGDVPVNSNIPTHIYNMTDFAYNPEAAKEVYTQLEDLINPKDTYGLYYDLSGVRMLFRADSYSGVNFRRTLIVPKGTPRPKLWTIGQTLDFSQFSAFTNIDTQNIGQRSFIEATDRVDSFLPDIFNTAPTKTTLMFAVEACQQIAYVRVFDAAGKDQSSNSLLRLTGQEVFCDILGYGIASAMLDIAYPDYAASTAKMFIGDRRTNVISNPSKPIPEDMYRKIKRVGTLIR